MMKVITIDRHRNGVCGEPFYVALVEDRDNRNVHDQVPLVVIVPERAVESGQANPESGLVECYALDPRLAARGDVRFGHNSWRGDRYFEVVREAALEFERERELALRFERKCESQTVRELLTTLRGANATTATLEAARLIETIGHDHPEVLDLDNAEV